MIITNRLEIERHNDHVQLGAFVVKAIIQTTLQFVLYTAIYKACNFENLIIVNECVNYQVELNFNKSNIQ